MRRRPVGAALPKILLLILFVCLLVGYFMWKAGFGLIGNIQPFPRSTANRIVFVRRDADGSNLFLINADGTGEQRLTDDKGNKRSPAWSPDGRQICYAGETRDQGGMADQLFLVGGGGGHVLTHGSGSKDEPQWRPDGKEIAFLARGAIKVVEPNGSNVEQVYPGMHKGGSQTGDSGEDAGQTQDSGDSGDPGLNKPPISFYRWSPDGQSIAGIQVTEGQEAEPQGQADWWEQANQKAAGPGPRTVPEPETMLLLPTLDQAPKLMINTNSQQLGFDWLPGDTRALVVSITQRASRHGIGVFRTDEIGAQPRLLMNSFPYGVTARNPVISPDGSQVAFEAVRMSSPEDSTTLGIVVMPVDPDHPLLVNTAADVAKLPLKVPGNATRPRWSPDGKRLLYQLEDSRGSNIWVVNADGSRPVQLTHSGSNFDAEWSPAR